MAYSDNSTSLAEHLTAAEFWDYLTASDTDTDNATAPPQRRWIWYCKEPQCVAYYCAWSLKTNFLLHLFETPCHRQDERTQTREGRRLLALAWREESAWDMSEPKKSPPTRA